jgi:hypothetical protein
MYRSFLLALLLTASIGRAEIIDRVMAVVNKHVITLSDIRREREIRSVLRIPASDDSTILKDMIDGQIIEDQIAQFPNIDILETDVENQLQGISDRHGLDPDVLRNSIRARLRTSEFFNLRFRQFLQASDEEVRRYYEDTFVPEARKRGLNPIPPLDQISVDLRSNVIAEKVVHDVESWLTAIRRRTDIEVFQ